MRDKVPKFLFSPLIGLKGVKCIKAHFDARTISVPQSSRAMVTNQAPVAIQREKFGISVDWSGIWRIFRSGILLTCGLFPWVLSNYCMYWRAAGEIKGKNAKYWFGIKP